MRFFSTAEVIACDGTVSPYRIARHPNAFGWKHQLYESRKIERAGGLVNFVGKRTNLQLWPSVRSDQAAIQVASRHMVIASGLNIR